MSKPPKARLARCLRLGVLPAAALVAWSPPPTHHASTASPTAATCIFNITARNRGTVDIWIMFYESQVRRAYPILPEKWQQLKIQNHRVAPGVTIRRSYTAPGRCDIQRDWRFKLRKGTNNFTATTWTDGGSGSVEFSLGDVNRHF